MKIAPRLGLAAFGCIAALLLAAPASAIVAPPADHPAGPPAGPPLLTGTITRDNVDALARVVRDRDGEVVGFDLTLGNDSSRWTMRNTSRDTGLTDLTVTGEDENSMSIDLYFAKDPSSGTHLTGWFRPESPDGFVVRMIPAEKPDSAVPTPVLPLE